MYTVRYSIKGARKVFHKEFATRAEAEAFAERWKASNSIGSYTARIVKV